MLRDDVDVPAVERDLRMPRRLARHRLHCLDDLERADVDDVDLVVLITEGRLTPDVRVRDNTILRESAPPYMGRAGATGRSRGLSYPDRWGRSDLIPATRSADTEDMRIELVPIGVVRTAAADADVRDEHRAIEGELDIFPEYAAALAGIDGYSHLFVVSWFDRLRPEQIGPLQVRPRRLTRRGFRLEDLPLLGVLALDSPTRPNPIGLTLVELLGRDGARLSVRGLDCFDGTPILDINGYRPSYRPPEFSLPEWYTRLMDATGHI